MNSAETSTKPYDAGPGSALARPPRRDLATVLERNIRGLQERSQRQQESAPREERLADAITAFTGSMLFVYIHILVFGFWVIANLEIVPGIPAWDPTFVVLAMIASVEAIFLSTFVLISQNRMAREASRRADLDLQISLLAEHEVTKLVSMLAAVAAKLDVETRVEGEIDELKRDVAPEAVLDEIEEAESKTKERARNS
jgi:uncharacterized membrane protein